MTAGTGSPGIRSFGSPAGTASSGKAVGTESPGTTAGSESIGTTAGTGSGTGSSGSTGHRVNWPNRIIRLDQLGTGIRLKCGCRGIRLNHGRQVLRRDGIGWK
ncbi:unnamed protein product, partial [Staurois parvus]